MKKAVPIIIFVIGLLASIAVLVLWIVSLALARSNVWWIIQGVLLMIPVMGGTITIFLFWTKSRRLDAERVNFISSVTHELLTPLASLRLYLETMMIRELPEDKQKQFLQLMLDDSERLAALIQMILAVSRIEHSKAIYRLKEADLGDIIESFIKSNDKLLKNAALDLSLCQGCLCLLDEEMFNTVLKNLLENAIKYSPKPAEISVSLEKAGRKLHLSISDKGEGLDFKDRKRVFKMFQRVSKKQGGTGLGLYIVRMVVKAHKGKAWAESNGRGKGTSIHILLPALKEGL